MRRSIPGTMEVLPGIHVQRRSSSIYAARKENEMKRNAAADVSTEGLLDSMVEVLSNTNGILGTLNDIEFEIHDAKAEGEPVASSANAVISLLDAVRSHYEQARKILLERLDVMVPKRSKEE